MRSVSYWIAKFQKNQSVYNVAATVIWLAVAEAVVDSRTGAVQRDVAACVMETWQRRTRRGGGPPLEPAIVRTVKSSLLMYIIRQIDR